LRSQAFVLVLQPSEFLLLCSQTRGFGAQTHQLNAIDIGCACAGRDRVCGGLRRHLDLPSQRAILGAQTQNCFVLEHQWCRYASESQDAHRDGFQVCHK
jgi:hypothetical protein